MKYKIFLYITFLFPVLLLNAQTETNNGSTLTIGFQGGINASRFQTELDSTNIGARVGWQGGMTFRYGNNFFVQGNIELAQSSVEIISLDTGLVNIKGKAFRNYMSVPIMLGYKVFKSEDGSSSFRLMAGMEASALLKVKIDENFFYIEKKDFEPYSLNIVGGIGADLWFIRLDLGVHYGLTTMIYNDNSSKNLMGTFNIGFTF